MALLASIAHEDRTVNTVNGGLVLLTHHTPDIIGIYRCLLDGGSHHPSSEVVGREILNSLLGNLEWTLALGALNFPAAARHYSFTISV